MRNGNYLLIIATQSRQIDVNLRGVHGEDGASKCSTVLYEATYILIDSRQNLRKTDHEYKKKQQSYVISSVIRPAPINISTSSHTDVVSLPVKRYCPTKIVSPSFTAYRSKRRRISRSYEDLQRKDVKMMMQRKECITMKPEDAEMQCYI